MCPFCVLILKNISIYVLTQNGRTFTKKPYKLSKIAELQKRLKKLAFPTLFRREKLKDGTHQEFVQLPAFCSTFFRRTNFLHPLYVYLTVSGLEKIHWNKECAFNYCLKFRLKPTKYDAFPSL